MWFPDLEWKYMLSFISCSTTFENLKSFYIELLPNNKAEEKPIHAEKFRQIMLTPLTAIKSMSQLVNKFADSFEKVW